MDINITRALECSEIFSLLGKKTEELVNTMERVELKPGEMLFVQGSTADCMYILTEGLLAATVRDKLGL
ncbi:MAG: cyclic nucleotide-binding domain-containing protein [Coxiellaceae bacterium]|nr:MAG: cyclic nucleotide-binding domain-containing protein [Coxiellaceae bacterium]